MKTTTERSIVDKLGPFLNGASSHLSVIHKIHKLIRSSPVFKTSSQLSYKPKGTLGKLWKTNVRCNVRRSTVFINLITRREKENTQRLLQGHPATFFCKITVRRSKYCLEI